MEKAKYFSTEGDEKNICDKIDVTWQTAQILSAFKKSFC